VGDFFDVVQADVTARAFDAADVAAVEAGEFGQDFLRPAAGGAKNTDTPGKEGAGGVGFGDHGKVVADGRAQGTLMKLIFVITNRCYDCMDAGGSAASATYTDVGR